jgi:hypothetical protein
VARIQLVKQTELTRAIARRLAQLWDANLMADEPAHSALLADDYRAVHPDGTMHLGKPSAKDMAEGPIEDYWLRDLEAWPVGDEGAIVTYTAEIEVRSGLSAQRLRFAVGEVWMKHRGEWKCRYYHGTMLK